ncbi:MAG TPA: HEAT repeat domain-containing protein [Gemmataceae bacterium]|nr:HEAT repeat domain-containing protein [Gemmataceae bacterium]
MERWMGSRTARWSIALAAGVMALLVGLTKFRVGAEEAKEAPPKTPVAAKPKREALRYGGKNFDQWRIEMETELKPEVRADGMTAMAAFGANGYSVEATRTILELMAGYDLNTDNTKDQEVVKAASDAIFKIADPACPVLWESVWGGNERSRLFAIECLTYIHSDWHPSVPDLLKAAHNDDVKVRKLAMRFLANVKNKPKRCLPVLLECLTDKESEVRGEAIRNLEEMRPEAKEVMSVLRGAIADSEPWVRYRALFMAGHYGAQAQPVVPALLKRLEKPESLSRSSPADEFVALMDTLAAIGPAAKEALPRLRKLREEASTESRAYDNRKTDREIIDETIKKIEGK